ncbi:hypothetical protein D3C85_1659500 [compost metagenome]
MAGYPADIGGTPIDVAIVVIENVFERHRGIHQITAGAVQYTFRFTSGAGGI